jgi:hypothetical protein
MFYEEDGRTLAERREFFAGQGDRILGNLLYSLEILRIYALLYVMELGQLGDARYFPVEGLNARLQSSQRIASLQIELYKQIPQAYPRVRGVQEQLKKEQKVASKLLQDLTKLMRKKSKKKKLFYINADESPAESADNAEDRALNRSFP